MPPPFIETEPSSSGAMAFNHGVLDPRLAANIKKEPSSSASASADAVLAPPALRVRASGRPLEILSGEAVVGKNGRLAPATTGPVLLFAQSVLEVTCLGELSVDPARPFVLRSHVGS